MKKNILILMTVLLMCLVCGCTQNEEMQEYIEIPIPDESNVELDTVTMEQIKERATELSVLYGSYEDIFCVLIGANYYMLTEDARQEWHAFQEQNPEYELKKPCDAYLENSRQGWLALYEENIGDRSRFYYKYPPLEDLYFDEDLIAQAEFVSRQLYNYVYEQDESAKYNIATYLLSEENSNVTEYAPLHYNGDIMQGPEGFFINSVLVCSYAELEIYKELEKSGEYQYPRDPVNWELDDYIFYKSHTSWSEWEELYNGNNI